MLFFLTPSRRRQVRKLSAPRARLWVETLESRATPSDLSGSSEFVVDTTASGDQYEASVQLNSNGEIILSTGSGPSDTTGS
ncbi:MAG TPA: hypothetical protein VNK04_16405 [Gemmataceae bacterium]|nr:hypothetical protein [Gemmataceae bacterium]